MALFHSGGSRWLEWIHRGNKGIEKRIGRFKLLDLDGVTWENEGE